MGAPKSCRQLQGQDLKLSLPPVGFSASRWGSNQVSPPSTLINSNRLVSTTSPVQQTKTPQQEKVAPAVVGPASRGNRHSDSKQRYPSKSRSRPDAKAAWELGLCLSKPEATMQIRPNTDTERSALSSLWLMSCDHHGSKTRTQHKAKRTKIKKIRGELRVARSGLDAVCQVELE